jgi:hypothetical protein
MLKTKARYDKIESRACVGKDYNALICLVEYGLRYLNFQTAPNMHKLNVHILKFKPDKFQACQTGCSRYLES